MSIVVYFSEGGILLYQSKAGMLYAALRRRLTLHRHPRICLRALRTHQGHLPIRQPGEDPSLSATFLWIDNVLVLIICCLFCSPAYTPGSPAYSPTSPNYR